MTNKKTPDVYVRRLDRGAHLYAFLRAKGLRVATLIPADHDWVASYEGEKCSYEPFFEDAYLILNEDGTVAGDTGNVPHTLDDVERIAAETHGYVPLVGKMEAGNE